MGCNFIAATTIIGEQKECLHRRSQTVDREQSKFREKGRRACVYVCVCVCVCMCACTVKSEREREKD